MRRLSVFIEMNGENVYVGEIAGKDYNDACFTYAGAYLENQEHRAISIGLPLEEKTFAAARTRIFFEGLLPEGFTRRCVAEWMHMDENVLNDMPVPRRLHQEDFAQALGIAAANKYEKNNEGYLKKLFDVIRVHSADPMTDTLKLWDMDRSISTDFELAIM